MHSAHLHGKLPDDTHITYPFMNVCFKTQARVIDFFPPKIEDFAHSLDDAQYNDEMDDDNDEMDLDGSQSRRWEWAFWLLLEDFKPNSTGERERVKLLVAGQDAEYLLRLDACE
jgi:protection-of-telomeres protein 1